MADRYVGVRSDNSYREVDLSSDKDRFPNLDIDMDINTQTVVVRKSLDAPGYRGGASTPDVTWFEYGTSTFDEVVTAKEAGQLCYVEYDGYIYGLVSLTDTVATFSAVQGDLSNSVWVDDTGSWNSSEDELVPISLGASHAGKTLQADSDGILQPVDWPIFPVTYNNTTFSEIMTAVSGHLFPVMVENGKAYIGDSFTLTTATFRSGNWLITVDDTDSWSLETWDPNALPQVTSQDEGKFAVVDSTGVWGAVAMSQWTGGNY